MTVLPSVASQCVGPVGFVEKLRETVDGWLAGRLCVWEHRVEVMFEGVVLGWLLISFRKT